jgi:hypothetical protein
MGNLDRLVTLEGSCQLTPGGSKALAVSCKQKRTSHSSEANETSSNKLHNNQ